MSKDTYSDDKKIESFKSLEISSGQNTVSNSGSLILSTSNDNDININPDRYTNISGKRTNIEPSDRFFVNTATIDIIASAQIDILSDTEVRSFAGAKNFIQSNNMVELDSNRQIHARADTTVDIRGNYIRVISSTDIKLGSEAHTNNIVFCGQRVRYSDLGGPVGDHRFVIQDGARFVLHQDYDESLSTSMAYETYKFYCRAVDSSGYIAYMANASNTDGSDILLMDFPEKINAGSNDPADVYIRFQVGGQPQGGSGSLSGNIAGAIKLLKKGEPAFRGFFSSVDTVANNAAIEGSSGDPLVIGNNKDGVCYATGNSDFGEWVECGDINEWSNMVDLSILSEPKTKDTEIKRLGLIEGMVAYVRELKFWRNGPGTPMLVTRSAALLGNCPNSNEDYIGETFSFAGQISVVIDGVAKCGDYLLPANNYCIAIPKDSITFEQYKNALGICWEDKDSEGLGRAICAIGIK